MKNDWKMHNQVETVLVAFNEAEALTHDLPSPSYFLTAVYGVAAVAVRPRKKSNGTNRFPNNANKNETPHIPVLEPGAVLHTVRSTLSSNRDVGRRSAISLLSSAAVLILLSRTRFLLSHCAFLAFLAFSASCDRQLLSASAICH